MGIPTGSKSLSTSAKSVNGIQSSTLSKIRNCRQASPPAPRCAPKGFFTSSAPPRGAFFLAYFKSPSSACSPIRNGSSAKGFGALTSILSLETESAQAARARLFHGNLAELRRRLRSPRHFFLGRGAGAVVDQASHYRKRRPRSIGDGFEPGRNRWD